MYIDNNHSYVSVKKDLELWWPLLAEGGVMAGSMYGNDSPRVGVKDAVDEFFRAIGLNIILTGTAANDPFPNWLVFKQLKQSKL